MSGSASSSIVIMEPLTPGSLAPAVSSGKGEHVFNAVNRIMEEQLKAWLDLTKDAPADSPKGLAEAAIIRWRQAAMNFAVARDDAKFHVANQGDAMNSSRYSRMKAELEAAAQEMASGSPSGMTRGYTTFNRRLNDLVLVDPSAPAHLKSAQAHSIDFTAAETVKSAAKGKEKTDFDAWFETTSGLMYSTLAALRDAALAVGRARAG